MIGALVREPFYVPLRDIADFTDEQIVFLYFDAKQQLQSSETVKYKVAHTDADENRLLINLLSTLGGDWKSAAKKMGVMPESE